MINRIAAKLLLVFLVCGGAASAMAQNNFYVANGGADAGSCQIAASPCATLNYVTQQALNTPANGQNQVIHMAAGSGWNESVAVTGHAPGQGTVGHNNELIFDGGGPTTVWNGPTNSCGVLIANAGANISVENMTMEGEGNACQSVLFAQMGGLIHVYDGIIFGPTYQQHMHAEGTGSQIQIWKNYTIAGGIGSNIGVVAGGMVEFNPVGINVTIENNPNFGSAFIVAMVNGVVYLGAGTQFHGAMTGQAYSVSTNATIFTDGAGCSVIPGTAGSSGTNGVCQ